MTIEWTALLPAVVLLGIPSRFLHSPANRKWLLRGRGAVEFSMRGFALAWQNWFDLARGFAGAWLLFRLAFPVDPELPKEGLHIPVWEMGILTVALAGQMTTRHRNQFFFLAPTALVIGVALALADPVLVLYSAMLGLLIGRVAENVEWFFPAAAAALGGLGYFWKGLSVDLLVACFFLGFPLLWTYLGRGKMIPLVRKPPVES